MRTEIDDMTDTPELAVILVNYNNEEDTISCLESINNQTFDKFITIVVDNGSEPRSYDAVRSRFDFPIYLRNDANQGFTGGNNRGIEYALDRDVEWILLLNNDTELAPDFLGNFLDAANDLPNGIGVVGPTIHTYGSDEIWSAGGTINRLTATTGSLHEAGRPTERWTEVDLVAGAALLARAGVFETVGLLDEEFFIYYEETEFCARVRRANWRVAYVPVDGVYHKETTTYSHDTFSEYYLTRNRFLYQQKTAPTHVRVFFYLYYLIRWVFVQSLYLAFVKQTRSAARATLRGAVDGIRGRTGKQHVDLFEYN